MGVLAPARTLVAVRAIAPVAGSPPNRGETIFAMPCPINSTLGLCLSLLMRSETTADMSDSIAPSIATVNAAEKSSDCLHRNMEQHDRGGRAECHQNRARNFLCELQAEKHDRDGKNGHGSCRHRKRVPCVGERHHAVKEIAGNVIHVQAE